MLQRLRRSDNSQICGQDSWALCDICLFVRTFWLPSHEPHGPILVRHKCNYFVPSILFLSYLIHNGIIPGRGEWNNHYHYLIDRAAFGSLFPEQTSWFVAMHGDWFVVKARSEMIWTKLTANLFPPAIAAERPSLLAPNRCSSHCRAHSVSL
jgi:hypothetical protein